MLHTPSYVPIADRQIIFSFSFSKSFVALPLNHHRSTTMNTLYKVAVPKRWPLLLTRSFISKSQCTTRVRSRSLRTGDLSTFENRSFSLSPNFFSGGAAAAGRRQQRSFHNTSSKQDKKIRPDPFARRPTAKCDPYGQGGKPLPLWEANTLLATLDPQWKIEESNDAEDPTASPTEDNTSDPPVPSPPQALIREFVHPDFIAGSKFVAKIAAVAQLNIHYPSIQLERRIAPNKKAWQVITQVRCHTLVLGGLSSHDFHLAMVRRVLFIPFCELICRCLAAT